MESEGYSHGAAEYSVGKCRANWNYQAVRAAEKYAVSFPDSKKTLKERLIKDEFSPSQAEYGADNAKIDYCTQALLSAQRYLRTSSFSAKSIIDQLMHDGFTATEAITAITRIGDIWNRQAGCNWYNP